MSILRNNIVANFGGQALSVVLALAFLPLYIRILGIEAYGLIGFFLSLQAFFTLLDMGLSATLNRELARYSHAGASADQQRDLVKTLEWLYWPVGLLILAVVAAASGPIARDWLTPVSIGIPDTVRAILLMGLSAALQWPAALYGGGFRGLERQVALNGLNAGLALVRTAGSVWVLVYVSPTLDAFLWWQVAIAALQTVMARALLWRMLPAGTRPAKFQRSMLRDLHAFTIGLTGIAVLSFLLVQSDRIILSKLLPLTEFGYYTLAATVASVLSSMIGPFFNALYPRYSGLVAAGRQAELVRLYHVTNQMLAVMVASVAAVLAFFSPDVLRFWTHDPVLARKCGPIMSLLVTGTALHGFLHLPYALQLAYGWTRLALLQNVVSVLIVVPCIWLLSHRYGGMGAASVWVALNIASIAVSIPVMHRRIMRPEMMAWFRDDIGRPIVAAVAVAGGARWLLPALPNDPTGIFVLGLVGICTLAATILVSPAVRHHAFAAARAVIAPLSGSR